MARAIASLAALPIDLQIRIIRFGGGQAIPAVASTCTSLQPLGNTEHLWKEAFDETFAPILKRWFEDGHKIACLQCVHSWRSRYIRFERCWMSAVFSETGTMLLRLHGHLYDITDFMDRHPGGPILLAEDLLKTESLDVGTAYDMVGHSWSADLELKRMLVRPPPGRRCWPAPRVVAIPKTTFPFVRLADRLRRCGALLLDVPRRVLHTDGILWRELLPRHRDAPAARSRRALVSSGVQGLCALRRAAPFLLYISLLAGLQFAAAYLFSGRRTESGP